MSSINFQRQFAEDIISGRKRQTIRPPRKVKIRAEDTLYLFTGMRGKNCRRLGRATCINVLPIQITKGLRVNVDGRWLTEKEREDLAHADGFDNVAAFLAFFARKHGLPFIGDLIRWYDFEVADEG